MKKEHKTMLAEYMAIKNPIRRLELQRMLEAAGVNLDKFEIAGSDSEGPFERDKPYWFAVNKYHDPDTGEISLYKGGITGTASNNSKPYASTKITWFMEDEEEGWKLLGYGSAMDATLGVELDAFYLRFTEDKEYWGAKKLWEACDETDGENIQFWIKVVIPGKVESLVKTVFARTGKVQFNYRVRVLEITATLPEGERGRLQLEDKGRQVHYNNAFRDLPIAERKVAVLPGNMAAMAHSSRANVVKTEATETDPSIRQGAEVAARRRSPAGGVVFVATSPPNSGTSVSVPKED